jgi:hypothetical protein
MLTSRLASAVPAGAQALAPQASTGHAEWPTHSRMSCSPGMPE